MCPALKENGSQRLAGSDTIRCRLAGVGVTLLGEVCHGGWALSSQMPGYWLTVFSYYLWIWIYNSKLFLQHFVCLFAPMLPTMMAVD